ncbi:hypothetical protein [Streptomyces sp. NPDC047123]|uniref:hypothetical protein n=1 Tax=Streptomyces sp. NPDC047123 TaxID=3155622 RepID=UPI0033CD2CC8
MPACRSSAVDHRKARPYFASRSRDRGSALTWAAIRFRAHDWLGWMWAPLDWALRTRGRRDGFVALVGGSQVLYIVHADGLHTLLTYGWAWVAAAGGAAWWFLYWLGGKDDPKP